MCLYLVWYGTILMQCCMYIMISFCIFMRCVIVDMEGKEGASATSSSLFDRCEAPRHPIPKGLAGLHWSLFQDGSPRQWKKITSKFMSVLHGDGVISLDFATTL